MLLPASTRGFGRLLLGLMQFREGATQESFNRLLPVERRLGPQVDGTRLRQRGGDRNVTIANQIRGPEMARAPRNGAVQQYLSGCRLDRRRERNGRPGTGRVCRSHSNMESR